MKEKEKKQRVSQKKCTVLGLPTFYKGYVSQIREIPLFIHNIVVYIRACTGIGPYNGHDCTLYCSQENQTHESFSH